MKYRASNKPKDKQTASPSKYPQGYFKPKLCRVCDSEFLPTAPSNHYCGDDCAKQGLHDAYLKRTYGISLAEFERMKLTSEMLCAICGSEGFILNPKSTMKLVVDHDHSTGMVRGLLCHNCNRALGLMKDSVKNLKKAISYLESATTISKESTAKQPEAQGTSNGDDIV